MRTFLTVSWMGLAACAGLLLPTVLLPEEFQQIRLLNVAITFLLAVFVWGAFHLAEPTRPSMRWIVIRDMAIPAVWLLLVLILGIWFRSLQHFDYYEQVVY